MKIQTRQPLRLALFLATLLAAPTALDAQQFRQLGDATCETPPPLRCPDGSCSGATQPGTDRSMTLAEGPFTEEETGLRFFLDYPCDLRPDEEVTVILSLHGAGAPGNWHRHYFPLIDFKDEYRLVIATPYSPDRRWSEEYDQYLRNVTRFVLDEVGPEQVRSFWLAGHSQGGLTSRRIVCSDFFRDRVDGFVSLSGGRSGGAAAVALNRPGSPPREPRPVPATPEPIECDFSHIYTTGEHEMVEGLASLPATSTVADRFGCGARTRAADIVDSRGGYVGSGGPDATLSWGRAAGPGSTRVWTFPGCRGGRIVADVVRMDKGHTEGLEPNVTESIVQMMVSVEGGKIRGSR